MQEEWICEGDQEGGGGHRPYVLLLRHRESRLLRMFLVSVLLLLMSVVLLLITMLLPIERRPLPHSQTMMQTEGHSGFSLKRAGVVNPSAMLTAPRGNNVIDGYLDWEPAVGKAFLYGGFSYSGGNLTVPRSGVYRVFLQITYEPNGEDECDGEDELRLTNTVFLISDAYAKDQPLVSAVDFVNCSMETWRKSLYTASLFSLNANCSLRVESSNPELIVKNEYEVFFGAELLPQ